MRLYKKRKHKFNAKKTVIDGITFASKKEGTRYSVLKLLQKGDKISGLTLQPKFELQPSFKIDGKTIRAITYVADFQYFDIEFGKIVVEDVKGFKTPVYEIKKKMFQYKFPQFLFLET